MKYDLWEGVPVDVYKRQGIRKVAHKYFLRFILAVGRIYQAGLLVGNMFQPYQKARLVYPPDGEDEPQERCV